MRHRAEDGSVVLWHTAGSIMLLLVFAGIVLGFWYPDDLLRLQGGWSVFLLVLLVGLVVGPGLSWLALNRVKTRRHFRMDVGLIVLLQVTALGYGGYVLATQKPEFLVFLHDRFHIITTGALEGNEMPERVKNLPAWKGGVRVVVVPVKLQASLFGGEPTLPESAFVLAYDPRGYHPLTADMPLNEQSGNASHRGGSAWRIPIRGRAASGMVYMNEDNTIREVSAEVEG